MPRVKRWIWVCNRCGHEFMPRASTEGREPKKCPKCFSPYWNRARVRPVVGVTSAGFGPGVGIPLPSGQ